MTFLEAVGWQGPSRADLFGRDIVYSDNLSQFRGPIMDTRYHILPEANFLSVTFMVSWVAECREGIWYMCHEACNHCQGVMFCSIDPRSTKTQTVADGTIFFDGYAILPDQDTLYKGEVRFPKSLNLFGYNL